MKCNLVLTFTLLVIAASCVPNKKLIYLQNLEGNEPIVEDSLINYSTADYKIQFNDVVDVQIQTLDMAMNEFLNVKPNINMQTQQMVSNTGSDIYYMTGHTVDKNGNIELPLVGEVLVANKSLNEIKATIEEQLKRYITSNEFFVRVKLGGIRFSTIGEFRRPGKFVVLQDRMTIFEAIAHSGDLNVSAKRDELLLMRQYPDGTKLHRVNLTDRNLIHSPYYFIQPNDQLYAEPLKIRELGSGENLAQSIQLVVTSVTAAVLILNLILK